MKILVTLCLLMLALANSLAVDLENPVPGRWSDEKINTWYAEQPWLVGCNYHPATAINQIEMWQASTWDPTRIDLELGWATGMGMNALRVQLHDMVWAEDPAGLYQRMDQFLDLCEKHRIRPWFVFFNDSHHPDPELGQQPLPVKAFYQSGWNTSPALDLAERYASGQVTEEELAQLKGYVQQTMEHFRDDSRILMWELYNSPGQNGLGDLSNQLVYDTWLWAREVNPSQPISSNSLGSVGINNRRINRINSDLQSIHVYGQPDALRGRINAFKEDGRPVIVTGWLARTSGSTVVDCLPLMKELGAGAINDGFVSGKTGIVWPPAINTGRSVQEERNAGNVILSGDPYPEPEIWYQGLLRFNGQPFDQEEIKIFSDLTVIPIPENVEPVPAAAEIIEDSNSQSEFSDTDVPN